MGLQNGYGLLHGTGGLDHLRQEHLASAEELAHVVHTGHQRAFDNGYGLIVLLQGLVEVFLQVVSDALDQGILQALLHAALAPRGTGCVLCHGVVCLALLSLGLHLLSHGYQPLGGIWTAVEDDVLNMLQQVGRQVGIEYRRGRVDNTHVHALGDGVVEEDGMHRLAQVVVAAEGEGEVAHAAADVGTRQVLANPARGLNKVECVGVVLLHAGGYGQYVRVKNDVMGVKVKLLCKQLIGSLTDAYLSLVSVGLSLLIKGHHHHGGTIALDGAGV